MNEKRNKDNLTDLVSEVNTPSTSQSNGGKLETPSGQVVTLSKKSRMLIKKVIAKLRKEQGLGE